MDIFDLLLKEGMSERYGWTPQQIDEMPCQVIQDYLAILLGKMKKINEGFEKIKHGRN